MIQVIQGVNIGGTVLNLERIDLNLLVYLDVLLRERNVTRAAQQLGITQPAMSNGLRRLRELFGDPLLVRTSDGMTPTVRALELEPKVREALLQIEEAVKPRVEFDPSTSDRVFRIMASDYAESTVIPELLEYLRKQAPNVILDILTPSDVQFRDVEVGNVDLVINRFDEMPQSFHQINVWRDSFSCVLSKSNPLLEDFSLDSYLSAQHVWVSKTGMGVGTGVNPDDVQKLGWVDQALKKSGHTRRIAIFTRHYQSAILLAERYDLVATVPTMIASRFASGNETISVKTPPFPIPHMELKMAWSPLLQHDPAHRWIRQQILTEARALQNA